MYGRTRRPVSGVRSYTEARNQGTRARTIETFSNRQREGWPVAWAGGPAGGAPRSRRRAWAGRRRAAIAETGVGWRAGRRRARSRKRA